MDREAQAGEERFRAYVGALSGVIGHVDRVRPLRDYCLGLLMPCERKSVEPMAALVAPSRVSAEHQSLLHLVGQAPWSDEAVLRCVRELVLPVIERQGPVEAWIVFQRRARTRLGWRANIAAVSASRTVARSWSPCRSPITRRACRSPIGSTCRKPGPRTRSGGPKPACRTR